MQSTNRFYLRGIDHLRALAAFMVLCYHCIHSGNLVPQSHVPQSLLAGLLEEGHTGVSLFITITGFIFATIIGDRKVDYPRFLYNRFLRIFPLLFILSLFAALTQQGVTGADPLAMVKFFNLFGGGTYWGTWTLVVEFQFYLFFPVFFQYFREHWRTGLRACLPYLGLIVLALAFRSIYWTQKGTSADLAYWTIFGRIDQFMLGVICSLLLRALDARGWLQRQWQGLLLAALAVLLLLLCFRVFNQRQLFLTDTLSPSLLWLLLPTIEGLCYSALILGWVVASRHWQGRVSAAFAYLGSISYSSYLIHFGVLLFCLQLVARFDISFSADVFTHKLLLGILLVYPLTLLLSVLSYELIEKPFFRRRVNYLQS
jgi:peptidoglycan/LPS O-acetylase OafA/YrhL